ncbi:MAG: toll/interleukin-1 receptor domain-containing protein [Pseudomonadota bacterium]
MTDVFISYTRSDRPLAHALAVAAAERGFSVWWDSELAAGEDFQAEIDQLLDQAKTVIVIWSDQSLASKWVKSEASRAFDRGVLTPVMVHSLQPPVPFNTTHTHDLSGWTGDPADPVLADFMEIVSRRVGEADAKPTANGELALADQDRLNQQEMELWRSVRTKRRRADLEQFVAQFPASAFTPLAREWLAQKRRRLPWARSLRFALPAAALLAIAVDLTDGRFTPLDYGRALYLAVDQPDGMAIGSGDEADLRDSVTAMADHLETQLQAVLADPEVNEPWEVAQMSMALSGLREIPSETILRYIQDRRNETCVCWTETPGLGDIGATSWVLAAKARLGAAPEEREIQALLAQQFKNGSWPVYFDTIDQARHASTYATAWAVIALMYQGSLMPESAPLRPDIDLALRRARIFLRQTAPTQADRRLDYPSVPNSMPSLSLAAIAVVMASPEDVTGPRGYGAAWAKEINGFQTPGYTERSDRVVYRAGRDQRFDTTGHTVFPWQLLAMTRVAEGADLTMRVKANRLLLQAADADNRGLLRSDRAWHAAETLIALRGALDGYFLDRITE